ncbi:hypothetical protein EUB07_04555 [Mycobacterium tuberculosis]|nr:hypothetical protein EUB07_04555 [Mycobacterium tuberculosis]
MAGTPTCSPRLAQDSHCCAVAPKRSALRGHVSTRLGRESGVVTVLSPRLVRLGARAGAEGVCCGGGVL